MIFEVDKIRITERPCRDYNTWLEMKKSYFNGTEWGEVLLSGFNAKRFYIWDGEIEAGTALTIFKRGPFRMGYLGFPFFDMNIEDLEKYQLNRMLAAISRMPKKPHLIRVPLSAFSQTKVVIDGAKSNTTIETAIPSLDDWTIERGATMRRDLKRAEKKLQGVSVDQAGSGAVLFDLHRQAVLRNKGKLKYTANYFNSLADEIRKGNVDAKVIANETLSCMVITVPHEGKTFYLHGGSTQAARKLSATDLLLKLSIDQAKQRKHTSFNLLFSSAEQLSLIKFKEKWGGISKEAKTFTIPTCFVGKVLLNFL